MCLPIKWGGDNDRSVVNQTNMGTDSQSAGSETYQERVGCRMVAIAPSFLINVWCSLLLLLPGEE